MTRHAEVDVLLLSNAPDRHAAFLRSLRARGLMVCTISDSRGVSSRLAPAPRLVLVDLAHPIALTHVQVRALNAARGPSLLVALHEGALEADPTPLSQLSLDGYCHARGWESVAQVAMSAASRANATLH